ncbi:MAG: zinc-ribbon domain-containing protein [Pseudomonadota bacterium]|nr:zinc-ribbon domain-containing protein [Pseudomonadota bacterium]
MILQCPECKARYAVPSRAVGPDGRTVRCARCQHSWHATPEAAAEMPDDLDKIIDSINARPISPGSNLPALRRNPVSLGLRVSAVVAGIAAIAFTLLVLMPGWVGFPRSKGLLLADIGFVKLADPQHLAYEISGKITNESDRPIPLPVLRVTLAGEDNRPLQYWDFDGKGKLLAPSESLPFSTGNLPVTFTSATHFIVDLGNPLELSLRRKPQ